MLPTLQQRIVIVLAVALGAGAWLLVSDALQAADEASGLSLIGSRVGLIAALLLLILVNVMMVTAGTLVSAMGNPLSGIFAAAAALCVLAGVSGPINGWLERINSPGAYGSLIMETGFWYATLVLLLWSVGQWRQALRSRVPVILRSDYFGTAADSHAETSQNDEGVDDPSFMGDASQAVSDMTLRIPILKHYTKMLKSTPQLSLGSFHHLAAMVVAGVIAGGLGYILIRNSDGGQVVCSLILSFTVGGATAGAFFPNKGWWGIMSSPFLVAAVSYGYVTLQYSQTEPLLAAWFGQQLPGLALALPIHYASAGVVGCCLGAGLAQAITAAKEAEH